MRSWRRWPACPRCSCSPTTRQRSWIAGNNQHIAALQGTYPNVLVGNWDALAADCPGSCFYDDGIHLRPDGQSYYTALIQSWSGLT